MLGENTEEGLDIGEWRIRCEELEEENKSLKEEIESLRKHQIKNKDIVDKIIDISDNVAENREKLKEDIVKLSKKGHKMNDKRIDHWCPKCKEYFGLEPGENKVCNECGTKLIREMGCPKDADELHLYKCTECIRIDNTTFACTRKNGHKGRCHAHDLDGACWKTWNKKEVKQ